MDDLEVSSRAAAEPTCAGRELALGRRVVDGQRRVELVDVELDHVVLFVVDGILLERVRVRLVVGVNVVGVDVSVDLEKQEQDTVSAPIQLQCQAELTNEDLPVRPRWCGSCAGCRLGTGARPRPWSPRRRPSCPLANRWDSCTRT